LKKNLEHWTNERKKCGSVMEDKGKKSPHEH